MYRVADHKKKAEIDSGGQGQGKSKQASSSSVDSDELTDGVASWRRTDEMHSAEQRDRGAVPRRGRGQTKRTRKRSPRVNEPYSEEQSDEGMTLRSGRRKAKRVCEGSRTTSGERRDEGGAFGGP